MKTKKNAGSAGWIDPDDAPEFTDEMFDKAQWSRGGVPIPTPAKRGRPKAEAPKVAVSLRLDASVLEYFRGQGPGWQTRLNDTLRAAVLKKS